MEYSTLLVTREDGVTKVVLNRPEVYNAFNDELTYELQDLLRKEARGGECRCLVIRGAGDKAFCSGQDVKNLGEKWADPEFVPHFRQDLIRRYHPVIEQLADFPAPTLAAVNGVAAGAGLSLALACDLRIAAPHAQFIEVFIRVGLVPDSGSSWFLPRIVGLSRALEMCLTGRPVSAEEALEMGLVNQVTGEDDFDQVVDERARFLATLPTYACVKIRKLLHQSLQNGLAEQLDLESYYQELAGHTEDHREGVMAFLEKRQAKFVGR